MKKPPAGGFSSHLLASVAKRQSGPLNHPFQSPAFSNRFHVGPAFGITAQSWRPHGVEPRQNLAVQLFGVSQDLALDAFGLRRHDAEFAKVVPCRGEFWVLYHGRMADKNTSKTADATTAMPTTTAPKKIPSVVRRMRFMPKYS